MDNPCFSTHRQYLVHGEETPEFVFFGIGFEHLVKLIKYVIAVLVMLNEEGVESAGGLLLHRRVLRL